LKKRVVVVGPREHVFHCLPLVEHYSSWAEARLALGVSAPLNAPGDELEGEEARRLAAAR
jgi:hypothetical protein